jgi:hypothetical protein
MAEKLAFDQRGRKRCTVDFTDHLLQIIIKQSTGCVVDARQRAFRIDEVEGKYVPANFAA